MSIDHVKKTGQLWFDHSLVMFFDTPVARELVITALAERLYTGGFVRASYTKAVLERELIFPTGLPTQPFGIAIPHTDPEHVESGAIAVGVLANPVQFREMGGTEDQLVDAHIVLALAIDDPGSVATVLRSLALAFQDPVFLTELKHAQNPETVIRLMHSRFPDMLGNP